MVDLQQTLQRLKRFHYYNESLQSGLVWSGEWEEGGKVEEEKKRRRKRKKGQGLLHCMCDKCCVCLNHNTASQHLYVCKNVLSAPLLTPPLLLVQVY